MNKIYLFISTIKYLKFTQIFFRIYYLIRLKIRKSVNFKYITDIKSVECNQLTLQKGVPYSTIDFRLDIFNFLNIKHYFSNGIDWNHSEYGKLWTYNLNYFDFLSRVDRCEDGVKIIQSYLVSDSNRSVGLESYPTSLRGINWVKFLSRYSVDNNDINRDLFRQYEILLDNLEYHLMGNHLLENGFSLLFGGYYFKEDKFYNKAVEILIRELDEQILPDGGHFELSPMYQQIILSKLLDCINLVSNNTWKDQHVLQVLIDYASSMLGWLKEISYSSLDIPMFNDSAHNIAPSTRDLFVYADRLGVHIERISLGESGYRKIEKLNYECILDIGNVQAKYIPGHTHADTFNFEVRVDGMPFIVDSGIGTYESNSKRHIERSTQSHNTVEVMNVNSSEVWGGFRVGNRAVVSKIKESNSEISATHDGYLRRFNILHARKWSFKDDCIIITDSLSHSSKAKFYIHFHPSVNISTIKKVVDTYNVDYKIRDYQYSLGFNSYTTAKKIIVFFDKSLKVKINLSDQHIKN
jgi:hypothetical protein